MISYSILIKHFLRYSGNHITLYEKQDFDVGVPLQSLKERQYWKTQATCGLGKPILLKRLNEEGIQHKNPYISDCKLIVTFVQNSQSGR